MRTRRPGSAEPRLNAAHPPSVDARSTFTFITPLGFAVPMTRAHVRLLGPCFKTGPESTQSSSVADRYYCVLPVRGLRLPTVGQARGRHRVRTSETLTALAAGPTQFYNCGKIPYKFDRRAAGRATEGLTRAPKRRDSLPLGP
ncbi:hypothetical protein HZH66_015325 [Vespula vulgaris]|uniref:Uncharacterized protein n=1 Tax=Vespula vulgaris TaxID=7454 RepID=A0A834J0G5_VESVU|nr:hypothetical protein HZH66_015325 [Vespula vulgaris]